MYIESISMANYGDDSGDTRVMVGIRIPRSADLEESDIKEMFDKFREMQGEDMPETSREDPPSKPKRKRRTKAEMAADKAAEEEAQGDDGDGDDGDGDGDGEEDEKPKRGRGRGRKQADDGDDDGGSEDDKPKRGRGRGRGRGKSKDDDDGDEDEPPKRRRGKKQDEGITDADLSTATSNAAEHLTIKDVKGLISEFAPELRKIKQEDRQEFLDELEKMIEEAK